MRAMYNEKSSKKPVKAAHGACAVIINFPHKEQAKALEKDMKTSVPSTAISKKFDLSRKGNALSINVHDVQDTEFLYNTLALAVNTLTGRKDAAQENKTAISDALKITLSAVVYAASAGVLFLKPPDQSGGWDIKLNKDVPLVREGIESGKQISALRSDDKPDYKGQFQGLTGVISRIRREATMVDKLEPRSRREYH